MTQIAVAAGVEEQAFSSCLASEAALTHVAETTSKALGLGINSTPTMYIGGQQIVGLKSVAELSALIDAELAKASGAPGGVAVREHHALTSGRRRAGPPRPARPPAPPG